MHPLSINVIPLNKRDKNMQKSNFLKPLIFVSLEILCFITLGSLLIGGIIFDPNNTIFSFTIFGTTAVILFNLLEFRNIRDFILLGILISIFILIFGFKNQNSISLIRNISWFIFIGIFVFYTWKIIKAPYFQNFKIGSIFIWIICFITIYFIMTLLNIYLFKTYSIIEGYGTFFYLRQAFKISSLLGLGIGIGYGLAKSISIKYKIM